MHITKNGVVTVSAGALRDPVSDAPSVGRSPVAEVRLVGEAGSKKCVKKCLIDTI